MTIEELVALVSQVTYKPGTKLAVFKDEGKLRVAMHVTDTGPGELARWIHISLSYRVPVDRLETWTTMEALSWVLECVDAAEEHETREWFKVNGKAVFDPHSG